MKYLQHSVAFAVGIFLLASCSPSLALLPDLSEDDISSNYTTHADVAYGNEPLQTMDIYQSSSAHKLKDKNFTVVHLHGGGWYVGDKSQAHEMALVQQFLKKGMNVVNMNYTLKQGVLISLEDITQALNYLAEHQAHYGLAMDKVILVGFSAGGSISATLGCAQNNEDSPFQINPLVKVSGIINFSGPVDQMEVVEEIFSNWTGDEEMREVAQHIGQSMFPDLDAQGKEELLKKVQAITYFDQDDPGVFLWLGSEDAQVPNATFDRFNPLLAVNPSKNKIHTVEGGGHYPSPEQITSAFQDIFEFLDKR
jgi:acetyl esterase/lipase